MVSWIRLETNLFDNPKIQMLSNLPKGDSYVSFWVRLLCMAGKLNNGGYVYVAENAAYTPQLLAAITGKPVALVKTMLKTMQELHMIDVDTNGIIYIIGWDEHQNIDGLEKIRDDAKIRQRRLRFRKVGLEYVGDEICAYCGADAVTVDHIIPKSKGGLDISSNAVPCCKSCNSAKGNKTLVDFLNTQLEYKAHVDIDAILANEKLNTLVAFDSVNNVFVNVSNDCNNVTSHVHSHSNHSPITPKNKNKEKDIENNDDDNNSISPIPSQEKRNSKAIHTTTTSTLQEEVDSKAIMDNVFLVWQDNISPLTPIVGEKVKALVEEYGEEAVLHGINAACEQNVRTIPYVTSCARNYLNGRSYSGGRQSKNDVAGTAQKVLEAFERGEGDAIWG